MENALDIRWYGARPDDKTAAQENSDAFDKAQEAIPRSRTGPPPKGGPAGWRIFVPPGTFHLARDLTITRGVHIIGSGPGGASRLSFPPDNPPDANHPHWWGFSVIITKDPDASECILRDLQIVSEEEWTFSRGPTVKDNDEADNVSNRTTGIHMYAKAHLIRVSVKGFSGTGIFIDADDADHLGHNANIWTIDRGTVSQCGGHGVHVKGVETAGGYCAGLYVSGVNGHGINDHSRGCTWIGVYVEQPGGRAYLANIGNNSTFLGCRGEGAKPLLLHNGTVFLGGTTGGPNGKALDEDCRGLVGLEGWRVYPFAITNPDRGTPGMKLSLGNWEDQKFVLSWEHPDEVPQNQVKSGVDWRLTWNDAQRVWDIKKFTAPRSACYFVGSTSQHASPHDGLIGFPAFLLGRSDAQPQNFSVSSAKPDPSQGRQGDLTFFDSPEPGGHVGWVKTGTGGWKKFGLIES